MTNARRRPVGISSAADSAIREITVEWLSINSIKSNPSNPRTHSRKQIEAIARSIGAFGWAIPVLVDQSNTLIAGHARLAAARRLGLQRVPVIRLLHLSPEQLRAYMIADNKLAERAGWDRQLLTTELRALTDLSFDVTLTGFESIELEELFEDFDTAGQAEDEVVQVAEGSPVSRCGEVFALGKHRLQCGDATNAADVSRLLDGVIPNLMVSDPPYGVTYDPSWRHRLGVNASRRSQAIANDDRADWREAWHLFPGNVAYVWHGALHATTVQSSLEHAGFDVRAQIIWAKNRIVIGRGDYHWNHEPCWYAVRKGCSANWRGNRKQSTVWEIPNLISEQDQATPHATQKPVECMRRPIVNNSSPGDAVYDPFVGSGTTIIAAERTGRVAYGMEIDARYVDLAIRRWQAFTGKDAVLAGENVTFDEITVSRRGEKLNPSKLAHSRDRK